MPTEPLCWYCYDEYEDCGQREENSRLVILDLCGGTGSWSRPYRAAGYDVRLVTLPECDVRTYTPPDEVHGVLAAPPCTEFAGSGARWWATKDPALLAEALEVFDACWEIIQRCQPVWWALENPIGRLRGLRPRLGDPRLKFNPCDYGDPYTKTTLVWGNFVLPKARPVKPEGVRPGQPNAWYSRVGGKSLKTKEYRSMTPPGFAQAFFEANP